MTNSYIKFQVNISKDGREKSGKPKCDGQTDKWTDGQTASKLRVPRQAGRGLINTHNGGVSLRRGRSYSVETIFSYHCPNDLDFWPLKSIGIRKTLAKYL